MEKVIRWRSASAVNSRCVPAPGNSRGSLRYAPLCTRTEHLLLAVFTLLKSARAAAALRFCLTAERQGDALFPRASPLQKSPTGAFLNSPLAEGFRPECFAVCGRRPKALPLETAAFEKAGETLRFCSPRLLFRSRLIKFSYECRVSGANDYVNCTKCKGPGSLLPGEGPGRAAPGGFGARVSGGHLSAAG